LRKNPPENSCFHAPVAEVGLTFQAGLRPLDEEAKDYTVENILRSSDAWLPQ